jgi:hypothetical protein
MDLLSIDHRFVIRTYASGRFDAHRKGESAPKGRIVLLWRLAVR